MRDLESVGEVPRFEPLRLAAALLESVDPSGPTRNMSTPSDDSPPAKAGPDCVMVFVDGTIVDRHSQHEGSGLEVKVGRVDVACLQTNAPAPEATPGNAAGTPTPAHTERQQELAELKESPEQKQYQAASGLVKQALAVAA